MGENFEGHGLRRSEIIRRDAGRNGLKEGGTLKGRNCGKKEKPTSP